MTVNAAAAAGGRVGYGLAQALAIWLALLAGTAAVREPAFAWGAVCAGGVLCVLLGQWHRRRGRADTAVGAFTGVLLWPLLIAGCLLAVGIVAELRSVDG